MYKITSLLLVILSVCFVSCDKPKVKKADTVVAPATANLSPDADFVAQLGLLSNKLKISIARAESGDVEAANEWRHIASSGSRKLLESIDEVSAVPCAPGAEGQRALLIAAKKQFSNSLKFDRAVWVSAKLGVSDAQWELYARLVRRTVDLPLEEIVVPAMSVSHAYMVDQTWVVPSGAWDPCWSEGLYRYDGVEFSPRYWLAKAAQADPKYLPRLAAVDFISARDAAGRAAAAGLLLSSVGSNQHPGDELVSSCLGAIYYRGVAVKADLVKSAEVMLGSGESALGARGVVLVCERDLVVRRPSSPYHWSDSVSKDLSVSADLYFAACSKYGYAGHARDLEKAYFYLFRYLKTSTRLNRRHSQPIIITDAAAADSRHYPFRESGVIDSADYMFARHEISKIEGRLSQAEVMALQKRCGLWIYRWPDAGYGVLSGWESR